MPNKAIFLDRDNTLIHDPGYINHPDQVKLLDGAAEALNELKALDYKLIVVTNQSAVARGFVTEKTLDEIHARLEELLAEQNASLDRIYYCPYHPDGVVPEFSKESDDRKPAPGMLQKAAVEMDLDLDQSWCIGDAPKDIEAGKQAGCKTILIDTPIPYKSHSASLSFDKIKPDYKAINMKEAVNIIKKHLRTTGTDSNSLEPIISKPTEPEPPIEEPAPQVEEQPPEPDIQEPQTSPDKTEELLSNILIQLKSMQRDDMFSEFSVMRLMAGMVQVLVLFCLLITLWFLMSPARSDNSVFMALGFAIIFQLMALTFYLMQGKK
jgi:D-glycero-D-manno-heptose 1,7-bisphosphate phosphatase